MLDNGDIIFRRTDRFPAANHYGVVVWMPDGIYVINRDRDNYGAVQPLAAFLKNRPILGKIKTPISGMSTRSILDRFRNFRTGEFHIVNNNCEKYAYDFVGLKNHRPETNSKVMMGLVGIGLLLIVISRS